MIDIYNLKDENIGDFRNYKQLFWSIKKIEKLKLLRGDYVYGQSNWYFLYRPYEKLSMVYYHMIDKPPTAIEKEAYEKQLSFIEIYKGSYDFPLQFLVTPELDIDKLRKNWCRDYCKAHGYVIGKRIGKGLSEKEKGLS